MVYKHDHSTGSCTPVDFTFSVTWESLFSVLATANDPISDGRWTVRKVYPWSNDWSFRNLISALPIVIRRSRVGPLAHPASMAYLALKGWMGFRRSAPWGANSCICEREIRAGVHFGLCLAEHPNIGRAREPSLNLSLLASEWITMSSSPIFKWRFSKSKKEILYIQGGSGIVSSTCVKWIFIIYIYFFFTE